MLAHQQNKDLKISSVFMAHHIAKGDGSGCLGCLPILVIPLMLGLVSFVCSTLYR